MAKYMTSGGPLGGTEVELEEGQTSVHLDHVNDFGRAFKLHYELREHDPESGAKALIFIGREPV